MAAEKLPRLGYQNVTAQPHALRDTAAEGRLEKGTALPDSPAAREGNVAIDTAESVVQWTGRNLLNAHFGRVALAHGSLEFSEGQLTGGEITLDLQQLTCDDLAGTPLHDVLIAHLKNDDFFDVEKFPTVQLNILSSESLSQHPGAPNLQVQAELTIKGATHPLTFSAATGLTPLRGKPPRKPHLPSTEPNGASTTAQENSSSVSRDISSTTCSNSKSKLSLPNCNESPQGVNRLRLRLQAARKLQISHLTSSAPASSLRAPTKN